MRKTQAVELRVRMEQLERRVLWSGWWAFVILVTGLAATIGYTKGVNRNMQTHTIQAGKWVDKLIATDQKRDSLIETMNAKLDSLLRQPGEK